MIWTEAIPHDDLTLISIVLKISYMYLDMFT